MLILIAIFIIVVSMFLFLCYQFSAVTCELEGIIDGLDKIISELED